MSGVNIVPSGVVQDTVGTCFRANRGGPRFRLGPTVNFAPNLVVVAGEWHDTDGVYSSEEPRPSAGPLRVKSGFLYLGWNRMEPPFELRIIRGRAAINGLTTRDPVHHSGRHRPIGQQRETALWAKSVAGEPGSPRRCCILGLWCVCYLVG